MVRQLSIASRIAGSAVATRGRMAAAVPRLSARRDRRCRALARALAESAAGRVSGEEGDWVDRIEGRRHDLAGRTAPTNPRFEPGASGMPEWADALGGTYPIDGLSGMFSIPPEWGRVLMRLVRALSPRSCLELGTGFGISGAYQAAALELNRGGNLITLDAAREWGAIAEQGFAELGLSHRAEFRSGQIADTLAGVADEAAPIDFVFLDAEHQAEPTIEYFEILAPRLSERAVVVFDDIGFRGGMRTAWETIARDQRILAGADVGRMGIAVLA
jgi:predicted O-methyltransferase YrrM